MSTALKYFKACFAALSNSYDERLADLLTGALNGSRNDYIVFLDFLEENNLEARAKLQTNYLEVILRQLSIICPQLIKSNLSGKKFSFTKPFNNRLLSIKIPLDKFYRLYYVDVIVSLDVTKQHNSINIDFKSGQEPIINGVEIKSIYKRNGRAFAFGHESDRVNVDDDRAEKLISPYEDMAREDLNKLINIFII